MFPKLTDIEAWLFEDYNRKLKLATNLIIEALKMAKCPGVAFSGGKNSLVVLHLVLQYKPDIIVIFGDTTNEYAETYRFIKKIKEEWGLNLYWIKPEMNFWLCMEKYGFPSPSRYREGVPKCCYYLKEKPFKKWCKLLRIDLIFTGISAFESRSRKLAIHRHGLIFKSKRWGAMRCHPIALWNEMDVWKYIEENKLPVNQAYEKYGLERIGCKFCTNYPGWEKVVSRIHPKTYRRIKRMMGEPVLDEFS